MTMVLALQGSPRKGGNSDVLLDWILKGVRRAGGEVEVIRLCSLRIQACTNCGQCDETGVCVLRDDMAGLYEKIIAAEKIILAAPIYFYGIPAHAKAFVDRSQALWNRKRLLMARGEYQHNPLRKGFLVSVAATKGTRVFDGARLTMTYAYDAMDCKYEGEFLVRGVDKCGDMAARTEILQEAEEAGMSFLL
jgi:multimeric flavodoxin WrbA